MYDKQKKKLRKKFARVRFEPTTFTLCKSVLDPTHSASGKLVNIPNSMGRYLTVSQNFEGIF